MTGGAFAYNFVELTRNLTASAEGYKILARDRLVVDSLQRFRVDFQLRLGTRSSRLRQPHLRDAPRRGE